MRDRAPTAPLARAARSCHPASSWPLALATPHGSAGGRHALTACGQLAARCQLAYRRLRQTSAHASGAGTEAQPSPQGASSSPTTEEPTLQLKLEVVDSIARVERAAWDGLVESSSPELNPFLLWSFLHALEASGSVSAQAGWLPQHVLVTDAASGALLGACPLYLKNHSYGEYVFDQSWADYSTQALGKPYYPKLQGCVPFTPVPGNRLLVPQGHPARAHILRSMARALVQLADSAGVSSLHITFNSAEESDMLADMGFLQRTGIQFHWENGGYDSFEDFLGVLRQSKRKAIRQERKAIPAQGLAVSRLSGAQLTPAHWDSFYQFYLATVDKRWGTAYLNREFFQRLGDTMADRVMLVAAAEDDGSGNGGNGSGNGGGGNGGGNGNGGGAPRRLVAGALNLIGSHALYGRNWGCLPGREYKHLHFELCYYQALEEAIARKLPRVEAGAQGEHKLQRGYLPSLTYSSHYLRAPELRRAVESFLIRERSQMEGTVAQLTLQASPYKQERTLEALRAKMAKMRSLVWREAA